MFSKTNNRTLLARTQDYQHKFCSNNIIPRSFCSLHKLDLNVDIIQSKPYQPVQWILHYPLLKECSCPQVFPSTRKSFSSAQAHNQVM